MTKKDPTTRLCDYEYRPGKTCRHAAVRGGTKCPSHSRNADQRAMAREGYNNLDRPAPRS